MLLCCFVLFFLSLSSVFFYYCLCVGGEGILCGFSHSKWTRVVNKMFESCSYVSICSNYRP